MSPLSICYLGWEVMLLVTDILLVEGVSDLHQIKNVDHPIAIDIWGGFAETVDNLNQV